MLYRVELFNVKILLIFNIVIFDNMPCQYHQWLVTFEYLKMLSNFCKLFVLKFVKVMIFDFKVSAIFVVELRCQT